MLDLWIGVPLLGGLVFSYYAPSQYSDLPGVSLTALRFEREGVIVKGEPIGHRTLRLRTVDGSTRITCTPIAPVSCLYAVELPLRARVRMFRYRGTWMILSVTDADGRAVLSEQKMLDRHRRNQRQYDQGTRISRFMLGILIALPLSWFMVALERWKRRAVRRREEREGTTDVG